MATATFTEVVSRVDQQLTNAIWADQIQDNVNQLAGSHRNQLVNGGFEVWQRGAGGFSANGAYAADRWILDTSSGAMTVTQETTTIDSVSVSSAKLVCTAGVSQTPTLYQKLEHWAVFKGQTVSCSLRVNQGAASGLRIRLNDGVTNTDGTTSATTGSWVTLTCTKTLSASATQLFVLIANLVNGTYYVDNCMLTIGPAPAPYRPLTNQEETARCQRYYEVHGGASGMPYVNVYGAAGAANAGISQQCVVTKATTPTVTKNGTWAVTNCGQPAATSGTVSGYVLSATVTALGMFSFSPNSSDDTVTIEANP